MVPILMFCDLAFQRICKQVDFWEHFKCPGHRITYSFLIAASGLQGVVWPHFPDDSVKFLLITSISLLLEEIVAKPNTKKPEEYQP